MRRPALDVDNHSVKNFRETGVDPRNLNRMILLRLIPHRRDGGFLLAGLIARMQFV